MPAFRVRTEFPLALMSATTWPSPLLTDEGRISERSAKRLMAQADSGRWSSNPDGPFRGKWVSSSPESHREVIAESELHAYSNVMDAQWVIAWFRTFLTEGDIRHTYDLLGKHEVAAAIIYVASAVVAEGVCIPLRLVSALSRVAARNGVPADVLDPVFLQVADSDSAWAWAHTLNLPRVNIKRVESASRFTGGRVNVEYTGVGHELVDWSREMEIDEAVLGEWLGREFARRVIRRIAVLERRENTGWVSLFHEDTV